MCPRDGQGCEPADARALPLPALDAAGLLAAWEEAFAQPSVQRAMTLLVAAWPSISPEDWLHTSLGRRDGSLLSLREELFGRSLEAGAACPSCGEHLEVALRTDDIRTTAPSGGGVVHVETCGYQVQARVPTSADLLAAVGHVAEPAHAALLRRCVLGIRQADDEVDAATLPDAVAQAVIRELAAGDPQAEVLLSLRCPACEHEWSTPFDILAYLWDEIDDWARRLLSEVHTLASAYGWSERDVLGMSARRRRLYLEMSEAWG